MLVLSLILVLKQQCIKYIQMGNIKQINIKSRTYYFFNEMINIKNFDSSLLKIDKKNQTKTLVFIISDTSQ